MSKIFENAKIFLNGHEVPGVLGTTHWGIDCPKDYTAIEISYGRDSNNIVSVNLEYRPYLSAERKYKGITSKRRYQNILKMRLRNSLRRAGMT